MKGETFFTIIFMILIGIMTAYVGFWAGFIAFLIGVYLQTYKKELIYGKRE